eukprot:CAMPEP_0118907038 /NCGR_PEP_ID=MMETSP1166-20130328/10671_1 /TAXON_ID=1104430 /ORGANISM="Chrysoreinhardia sp, Strain CCMP3193" /LENGTH=46 /DNA_ID= /DNA_START= /DNA_END= /DNA_ORIENTATION=
MAPTNLGPTTTDGRRERNFFEDPPLAAPRRSGGRSPLQQLPRKRGT